MDTSQGRTRMWRTLMCVAGLSLEAVEGSALLLPLAVLSVDLPAIWGSVEGGRG